jgi:methylmalonyl-CoA carboxyltransferase small subunit
MAAAPRIDTSIRIPAAAPIANGAAAAKPPADAGPVNEEKVCRSPVSGIVVRVTSQVGQKIQAGDTLLVLEAMKMETNVTSPVAGKVKKVRVAQSDGVQLHQILVEFE